jgi:hypothetical protein
MNTETTIATLPKFVKIDSTPEDKGLVQKLRNRFDVSEKQLVSALLLLASKHEAQLLEICNTILDDVQAQKATAKAAKTEAKKATAKRTKKDLVAA